jgi:hypothetical protein
VGPRAGLDRCGKSQPPPGFDPRTVQPVASRYTDYATRPIHTAKTELNVLTGVSFEFQWTCPITTERRNTTNKTLMTRSFNFLMYIRAFSNHSERQPITGVTRKETLSISEQRI